MLIAEFILVVGGVLVALWLDSVKQSYRDRLLEKQYLEELEEDPPHRGIEGHKPGLRDSRAGLGGTVTNFLTLRHRADCNETNAERSNTGADEEELF